MVTDVTIPPHLLPADGRFGSGPTRVRDAQVAALGAAGRSVLGTSHRQPAVKDLVARVRAGVADLLGLPDGYEVVLGNGGSTAFWDAAAFCLVRSRAQHAVHGEFSGKFATVTERAPFLEPSVRVDAAAGSVARLTAVDGVDAHAYPHNETSTGALSPVERIGRRGRGRPHARRRDVRGRRRRGRPHRDRRLLLRAPEGVRRRRRPVARHPLPRRDRAHRGADRRPLGAARPVGGADELAQGPDAQHARRRHARHARGAARLAARARRARVGRRPVGRERGARVRLGGPAAVGVALRGGGLPLPRRRRRSTSTASTAPRSPGCCGTTACSDVEPYRGLRSTSCGSASSRRCRSPTSRRSPRASTTSSRRSPGTSGTPPSARTCWTCRERAGEAHRRRPRHVLDGSNRIGRVRHRHRGPHPRPTRPRRTGTPGLSSRRAPPRRRGRPVRAVPRRRCAAAPRGP